MIKKFVLTAFAVFALSLAAADTARACVCFLSPEKATPEAARAALVKDFNEASAVFTGEVVALDALRVTLKVEKLWKGNLGDEVVMPTGARKNDDGTYSVSSCDYTFARGEKYLIFAYGDSAETMRARACTRTKALGRAGPEVEELDAVGPHEKKNRKPPGGDGPRAKRRR